MDKILKTPLVLQTAISTDHQMEKFQEKILQAMGPFKQLWKRLKDVWNKFSEIMEVPVDKFATLIHLHIIEIERLKKESLEVFEGSNEKNNPFWKGPLLYQNRRQVKGNTTTQQNQAIETKPQIFDFKTMPVQVLEKPVM